MKFEKVVTINLGNYESLKLGVADASSFEECDIAISKEAQRIGLGSVKGIKS
jgi:hypothetical protein